MRKVIGVIPARYHSTRLEGKALALIAGKPMIQRVYEQASKSKVLEDVFVATDDKRIKACVEGFGGKAVMTSPNHPSGTDRIAEAVAQIETEIVTNIQGDLPFIDPRMIDEAVQPLLKHPNIPMATLMKPMTEAYFTNPDVAKVVVDKNGFALYFSRSLIPYPRYRQGLVVYEHIGLYVYRKEFLQLLTKLPQTYLEKTESLEQLRVLEHGYKIFVTLTKCKNTELSGFSVDTREDLEEAERLVRKYGMP